MANINTDDPSDEPTQDEVDAHELLEQMGDYSQAFHTLRKERDAAGAAEYGKFTFLENDVVRMMAEELADTANYCEMQFIKLMLINNLLVDQLSEAGVTDEAEGIGIGLKAFKGTKAAGWGAKS